MSQAPLKSKNVTFYKFITIFLISNNIYFLKVLDNLVKNSNNFENDLLGKFKGIKIPTLIVWGQDDEVCSLLTVFILFKT